jgi:hypothetical protein
MITRIFDPLENFVARMREMGIPQNTPLGGSDFYFGQDGFSYFIEAVVSRLSEERAGEILQRLVDFKTRFTYSDSCRAAELYVRSFFQGLGFEAEFFPYQVGKNTFNDVIGTQIGTVYPDKVYIICGHLDSMSEFPLSAAPGADDNGSGSTGVLMAAELLSRYEFESTIKYICFTGEEQGLWGSEKWVEEAVNQGLDIAGVINLDMISYMDSPTPDITVIINYDPKSKAIADKMIANSRYYSEATFYMVQSPHSSGSDHFYFWYYGYPAVFGIETGTIHGYPYYHTSKDLPEQCSIKLLSETVKSSAATLIELASPDTINPVNIHLTYDGRSVYPGKTLEFTFNIVNNRCQPVSGSVWAELVMPGGKPYPKEPFFGPVNINLKSYEGILGKKVTQKIPTDTSGGKYTYIVKAGIYPEPVLDQDSFEFIMNYKSEETVISTQIKQIYPEIDQIF